MVLGRAVNARIPPELVLEVESALFTTNDNVRVQDYRHLLAGGFEGFAGSLQFTVPGSCFLLRQVGLGQNIGQIAADTNHLVVGHKPSERFAVLEKDEGNVLIVGPVNAVGKIARRLCDGYALFFHNLIIRLFDCRDYVSRLAAA